MTLHTRLRIIWTILGIIGAALVIGVNYKSGGLAGLDELAEDTLRLIGVQLWHPAPLQATKSPELRTVSDPAADEVLWSAIKDSSAIELFQQFIITFPASSHVPEAQTRINDILARDGKLSPQSSPAPRQFINYDYPDGYRAGSIIINTDEHRLYLVLGDKKAMQYDIGVGSWCPSWQGPKIISAMMEWPDWFAPADVLRREPWRPPFMAGGESNPLGARAIFLDEPEYVIHGTNHISSIGRSVSDGCILLTNADIADLYGRVMVGATVYRRTK